MKSKLTVPTPPAFTVADRQGTILLDVDNGIGGTEDASTEISEGGIHFLISETALHDATTFDISSSEYLHPFTDRDDGRRLHMNVTIAGNIDYPGDRDWYSIHLREGRNSTILCRLVERGYVPIH